MNGRTQTGPPRGVGPRAWAGLLAAALLAAGEAGAAPATNAWAETGAIFRMPLRRAAGSRWPATCGRVVFCAGPVNPARCPVSVRDPEGRAVGTWLVWGARGDPIELLFDTSSGADAYTLYAGGRIQLSGPASWRPEAGLMLEVRGSDGATIDSFKAFRRAWGRARDAQGRTLVRQVFYGFNRFGPDVNYLARCSGVLTVPEEGTYGFATDSDDASFLLLDGRVVAQWPGDHGPEDGRHGQHHGTTKLAAGPHTFEYLHAQGSGLGQAVAAWRPPGDQYYTVIPSRVFAPVAAFQPADCEASPRARGAVGFGWTMDAQLQSDGHTLVRVVFAVTAPSEEQVYRWVFDDGGQEEGSKVSHWFLRPGMRGVRLEVYRGGRRLSQWGQQVRVHPVWSERQRWSDKTFAQLRPALLKAPLAGLPLGDLVYLFRWCRDLDDTGLQAVVGRECLRRSSDLPAADADVLLRTALALSDASVRDYDLALSALRSLLERADVPPELVDRARVRLAELLLHVRGRLAEARAALAQVDARHLSGSDARQWAILKGDALLAAGDAEGARRAYLALTPDAANRDRRRMARRRTRLEYARDLIRRSAWDKAAELLVGAEWDEPIERLSPDTGLAIAQVFLGREEYARAAQRCRVLLPVAATDDEQSELLYRLAQAQFGLGQAAAARETLARLRKDHPYSEAAARAKDRWPG